MTGENKKIEEINSEDDVISWEIEEYDSKRKSKKWYLTYSLVGLALLAYAIFTQNLIFAILIIVFAILIVILDGKKTKKYTASITDQGVGVGKEFYAYDQLSDFFIVYKPEENEKNLYLQFKLFSRPTLSENDSRSHGWILMVLNLGRSRLSIPLNDMNPLAIRKVLLKYLKENLERTNTPLSEQLTKLFKL